MKKSVKTLSAFIVVVNLCLIGWLILSHKNRSHSLAVSQLKMIDPQIQAKLEKQITTLERESAAESLEDLKDVNWFFWPGAPLAGDFAGGITKADCVPLSKDCGQFDIETICSNRRFRKTFADLSAVGAAKASEMINHEFERTTAQYLTLYESEMRRWAPQYKNDQLVGKPSISGPGFETYDVPKGQVAFAGVRLKVLSLVWLSGFLKLSACSSNIDNVALIAVKQRNDMYQDPTLHDLFKMEMLRLASLYNRAIISSALLGVHGGGDAQAAILKEAGVEWEERKLSSYNAALTEYDFPVRSGPMKPDYSRGSWTIKVVAPLDDSSFDNLLKKCGVVP